LNEEIEDSVFISSISSGRNKKKGIGGRRRKKRERGTSYYIPIIINLHYFNPFTS